MHSAHRMRHGYCCAALLLSLGGCALLPSAPVAKPVPVPAHFSEVPDRASAVKTAPSLAHWWRSLNEPELDALIVAAHANNTTLAQASARLAQASAGLSQANAGLWPELSTSSSASRAVSDVQPDRTTLTQSLRARWHLDLFGSLRFTQEAARANWQGAQFALADARLSITAEVVRSYLEACSSALRLRLAKQQVATQAHLLRLARARNAAGLVAQTEVEQVRLQLTQNRANVSNFQRALANARNRLAVLSGQAPGVPIAAFEARTALPNAAAFFALGVPADLMRNRPDIRSAEQKLLAANAQIAVAQASLWPQLTLNAAIEGSANTFASLRDALIKSISAASSHTLFDAGNRDARLQASRAGSDEAFASYRGSVLKALEDVENAIAARTAATTRLRQQQQQMQASAKISKLAQHNLRAGLSDTRAALEAKRNWLSARDVYLAAQNDSAVNAVQLWLALGGGWTALK
jgi:outer membrane protein, multidrug efflux system